MIKGKFVCALNSKTIQTSYDGCAVWLCIVSIYCSSSTINPSDSDQKMFRAQAQANFQSAIKKEKEEIFLIETA
ncbi:CLUMA_CG003662, isoform A [Clunio marinus]|uniref:CLUMA_CG003662, isoform A n=1 Tax=Clunio marinus TaxID=568069 RepID=A0A1J1HRB3_9DIPT|nr:CLUMA_CG003662, isoform A [Clunio marinus]